MSSDGTQRPENGCPSAETIKTKTTLKSLVIPDHDSLKIKLKISKKDIENAGSDCDDSRDSSSESKSMKSQRNSLTAKTDAKNGKENSKEEMAVSEEKVAKAAGDPKRKLRSKKETDGFEEESEDPMEERRRRRETWLDRDYDKPKKRSKLSRYPGEDSSEKTEETTRSRRSKRNEDAMATEKYTDTVDEPREVNKESFCWTCHKDGSVVKCDTCPRVFHLKCVSLSKDPSKDWICPECSLVLHAEKMSTRSEAMKSLSLDQLCTLLNFAIGRMKNVPESQAFWKPVDPREVPFYDKYITNPMDLNLLEKNMKAKMYGSPQAFLADTKWLLHNSIIFNSTQSPLTSTARFLVKICRQEMAEIENCPDCYLNAHTKEKWFIEVCRKPHILIWARLKGFPFWPAKAMSTNLKTQQVDARFFGAHDKAWVPVKECFLYSKNSPQLFSKKRSDLDDAFLEAEGYIKKIRQKYGTFCYAPDKTPFVPEMYDKQLQSLIPNFKEEKPLKKKRKSDQTGDDQNGLTCEKDVGKKPPDSGTPHRFKLKRSNDVDTDVCIMNDDEYASEEKVVNESASVSPEDEIARRLEMYDTHKKLDGEAADENSTDLDEDASVPIPEHGYSRRAEATDGTQSPSESSPEEKEPSNSSGKGAVTEVEQEVAVEKEDSGAKSETAACSLAVGKGTDNEKNECVAESSEASVSIQGDKLNAVGVESTKTNSEQCEVSSTSADLKVGEREDQDDVCDQIELDSSTTDTGPRENEKTRREDVTQASEKATAVTEASKKEDDRATKSFVNLTCDQKEKILNEAKLLANIDEMTALGKQKVLNELGLDASNVDIRQLAKENRQILATLNKTCPNPSKSLDDVTIKNEEFEQYLLEENSEENIFDEEDLLPATSPKPGSIKVRDIQTLSKQKTTPPTGKPPSEPILKIMDVQSLRDLKEIAANDANKSKGRKSIEEALQSKKLKLEPVVELIKLDAYNKSVEKLNRKLRLSDEVSLLMVDGDKKVTADSDSVKSDAVKGPEKVVKTYRARKSMPNRAKPPPGSDPLSRSSPKNINVISVDTENSTAQKNLLKSLRLEEKKAGDEAGRKTVVITTGEKGFKNMDVKNNGCESSGRKQIKEVTIEAVKDTGREGAVIPGKNVAVVANSHLIVTNQGSQPNLALAQNNLGQLSLVHLSNLTSGIQTNFVNLTNETIGFNNSIGTLYTSPGFSAEFPATTATGSVILTPTLTASLPATVPGPGAKAGKSGPEQVKLPMNRVGSTGKSTQGISVKSPATLGLIASQPSKLPPLIAIPGEGIPVVGDVGSVTAELNKHSVKMAEYMRATIEDILRELSNQGSLEAKYKLLSLEMEKLQWRHQQEIMELKHHSERSLMELRNSLESDKQKCLSELKAQLESQHQKMISETKRKQWCANCGKEALFYCCWNTSYCDYPCQQQHWPGHMSTCAQLGNNVSLGASTASQLQSKAPRMKYHNSNHVPVGPGADGRIEGDGSGGSLREKSYRPNRFS